MAPTAAAATSVGGRVRAQRDAGGALAAFSPMKREPKGGEDGGAERRRRVDSDVGGARRPLTRQT